MRISLTILIFLHSLHISAQQEWVHKIRALEDMQKGSTEYAAQLADICWEISELSPDSARYYCDLAEKYAISLENDSILTRALLGSSVIDSYKGQHAEAIEKSFKALKIAEAEKDTLNMADAVNNIGIDLYYKGEFKEAIKYYKLFATYSESIGNLKQYANALNNMAMIESELGNSQEEIRLYEEAIKIFNQIGDSVGISNASINLGVAYADLAQHEKAISYFKDPYHYFKKYEFTSALAELLTFWAASLNELGLKDAAIKKLREAIVVASASENTLQELFAYELLHKIFYDLGQLDSAYFYQAKYQQLFNKEREYDKQQMIQELKVSYETEKKEQQIATLEQENRLKELEANRQRQWQIFLGVMAIFLILAVVLLYSRYTFKNKTNRELDRKNKQLTELNLTKDRLFSIISHDLKSPLSSFHTITKSLTDNWNQIEKEQLKDFIISLRDSSKEVHNMMDNLLRWALSQTDQLHYKPRKVDLKPIVDKLRKEFTAALSNKNMKFHNTLQESTNLHTDLDFINIILRNLISNAIKYCDTGGEISIQAVDSEEAMIITVKDTGIGMTAEHLRKLFKSAADVHKIDNSTQKGTGLGLTLCRELMDKMGGELQVESEYNAGSTFKLIFPKNA